MEEVPPSETSVNFYIPNDVRSQNILLRLATCFFLISSFAYPLVLKMEGVPPYETSVNFYRPNDVRSQNILLLFCSPTASF
jgi:hypothetical protein